MFELGASVVSAVIPTAETGGLVCCMVVGLPAVWGKGLGDVSVVGESGGTVGAAVGGEPGVILGPAFGWGK